MRLFLLLYFSSIAAASLAADASLTQDGITISASARTAQQMRAFYSARGLPDAAVQEIAQSCFITVGIHNKRAEVLWLDLSQWRFVDAQGLVLTRLQQADWRERWTRLQLPLSAQATFGWTQMPELRDLQADESVGGNIPLVRSAGAFTLHARFALGTRDSTQAIALTLPNLRCADDASP